MLVVAGIRGSSVRVCVLPSHLPACLAAPLLLPCPCPCPCPCLPWVQRKRAGKKRRASKDEERSARSAAQGGTAALVGRKSAAAEEAARKVGGWGCGMRCGVVDAVPVPPGLAAVVPLVNACEHSLRARALCCLAALLRPAACPSHPAHPPPSPPSLPCPACVRTCARCCSWPSRRRKRWPARARAAAAAARAASPSSAAAPKCLPSCRSMRMGQRRRWLPPRRYPALPPTSSCEGRWLQAAAAVARGSAGACLGCCAVHCCAAQNSSMVTSLYCDLLTTS